MEGPEAAYVQSDLYADVMAEPVQQTNTQDLENGVLHRGPLVSEYRSYTTIHPKSMEQQEKESKIAANVDQIPKGLSLYIGNLTWWTNDEELSNAIRECGVNDLLNIKFFENRINGQSKGFCLIEVGSETSQRLCMERLPNQNIHNQKPLVTFVNKQSLTMFENQCKKDKPVGFNEDQRKIFRDDQRKVRPNFMPGPQIIHGLPPPGANVVAAPMLDHTIMQQQLQLPAGFPPGSIIVDAAGNIIHGGMPGLSIPGMMHGLPVNSVTGHMAPHRSGVAPHLNPAFVSHESQPIDPMTGLPLQTAGLNEQDMESMRRNQAVASTAIQRAMTDANAGEFESGIETLVTAISLIKQSTTASTDPAQVLIQSLQDCLQGLEGQLVQKGSGGSHRSNRYDDYEYDRDRNRRRRERSRSHGRQSFSPRRSRSRERRRR
ncbi:cleavage and polyadenylation specificity factor subunit 6 isoform X1 [Hydra vulgaris]|uniref:Cleavage and polyadenylation specificity factor subunit 6 n=1 Tax=Hydra vulgaris TaxID=6087 RepID=T2M9L4_HYDVU|nr:cleavage and polyadenylation specificity factor subunit 6-like [Hydra vulgaris]XP_047134718.1 cleavage and polyadenylation specificity factor subunit 6-like [Hydra vulgaris]